MAYIETRTQEVRRTTMAMVDGHMVMNRSGTEGGTCVRAFDRGYWGQAATSGGRSCDSRALADRARRNAQVAARLFPPRSFALAGGTCTGDHVLPSASLSRRECADGLAALHAWCAAQYRDLKGTEFVLSEERHHKHIVTSTGSDVRTSLARAQCRVTFRAADSDGAPTELVEYFAAKGGLGDLDWSTGALAPVLGNTYEQLQAKRSAVPARCGEHTIVLSSEISGLLAHEAMGHCCEADLVLGGAVTRELRGQRVGSELLTLVDFANTANGEELSVPVYVDDEGVAARDVVLIQDGILMGFMNSRESAALLGASTTGNARAYGPTDDPLVRMRNTAIMAGGQSVEGIMTGVADGYLLLKATNGQADSTTDFMFGISFGYEIHNGRLGRPVRDTTLSGNAIDVLTSVDAVGDAIQWRCGAYCGKKQLMLVSMGGPTLRVRARLGGVR